MSKRVCFFGSYAKDYARNVVLADGLVAHRVNIYYCHSNGPFLTRNLDLIKQFLIQKNKFNTILVGFPGHFDLPLAFILGKIFKKKVIFDIFASKYETYVLDRKYYSPFDVRSFFYYLLDWLDIILADTVLTDTKAHLQLYQSLFHINSNKFVTVYVGAEEKIYYPKKIKQTIDVFFYGSYQPLQGTEYIIQAAALLRKTKFVLVGNGQKKAEAVKLAKANRLKNVQFIDWVSGNQLSELINKSKIILGIFDNNLKAQSVIPNKVYGAIACSRPVITANSTAIRELFSNNKDCLLVSPANPKEIAKEIERLLKNKKLIRAIAKGGFNLFRAKLISKKIVEELVTII